MKTQALYFPNGMLGSAYFCSILHNDKGVVNLSGIESALKEALEPYKLGMAYPKVYGDEIFEPSEVLCKANGDDSEFTARLTSSRGDIEHVFGLSANLWKRASVKHTWQILRMENFVFAHLFSILFMTNCYTCIHRNKTSTKYGFAPYPLEDYLNVTIEDAYDGDDVDEYMAEFVEY